MKGSSSQSSFRKKFVMAATSTSVASAAAKSTAGFLAGMAFARAWIACIRAERSSSSGWIDRLLSCCCCAGWEARFNWY